MEIKLSFKSWAELLEYVKVQARLLFSRWANEKQGGASL